MGRAKTAVSMTELCRKYTDTPPCPGKYIRRRGVASQKEVLLPILFICCYICFAFRHPYRTDFESSALNKDLRFYLMLPK